MPLGNCRSAGSCGCAALLLLWACVPTAAEETPAIPRIRTLDSAIARVLASSVERSPTLRGLIDALEDSDLIVHLTTFEPAPTRRQGGDIRLAGVAGGIRYVRVGLSRRLNDVQMAAMLAHELQHALELAENPEARDERSLRALYEQIGFHRTHGYETREAIGVEDRVAKELGSSGPRR